MRILLCGLVLVVVKALTECFFRTAMSGRIFSAISVTAIVPSSFPAARDSSSTRHACFYRDTPRFPAGIGPSVARAPQLHSAKQLRVRSHDHGRRAHRDCADTHGEIKPPANQQTPRDRNGDEVISARPNEILHHLSVGCSRQLDCPDYVARIATHEHDSRGFNRDVRSRTDRDSYIGGGQGRRVVHAVADHRDLVATSLKALYCRSLVSGKHLGCDFIDSETPSD